MNLKHGLISHTPCNHGHQVLNWWSIANNNVKECWFPPTGPFGYLWLTIPLPILQGNDRKSEGSEDAKIQQTFDASLNGISKVVSFLNSTKICRAVQILLSPGLTGCVCSAVRYVVGKNIFCNSALMAIASEPMSLIYSEYLPLPVSPWSISENPSVYDKFEHPVRWYVAVSKVILLRM